MKRAVFAVMLLQLLAATGTGAQHFADYKFADSSAGGAQIVIRGFRIGPNGGEKDAGVSLSLLPTAGGKQSSGVFSMSGCGGFWLNRGLESPVKENATTAWRIEITPTGFNDGAAAFRLRWTRALDNGKSLAPSWAEVPLTLRPGDAFPIDRVPVPASAATSNGERCDVFAASLRVSVEYPDFDNRLVAADVWFVEKFSNGSERSQLQSLRGMPYRSLPFYFDRILEMEVDVFGHVEAEPSARDVVNVRLEAVRGVPNPEPEFGYQAARYFRATLRLKPDEVVEVPLSNFDEKSGRTFSLRIRAKQLR